MKKSVCNRFIIDLFGNRLYEIIISYLQKNPDCASALKKVYCNYNWKYEPLYKIAKLFS